MVLNSPLRWRCAFALVKWRLLKIYAINCRGEMGSVAFVVFVFWSDALVLTAFSLTYAVVVLVSIHGEKSLLVCTEFGCLNCSKFSSFDVCSKIAPKNTNKNVKPSSTANVRANLKYCFVRREIASRFSANESSLHNLSSLAPKIHNSRVS